METSAMFSQSNAVKRYGAYEFLEARIADKRHISQRPAEVETRATLWTLGELIGTRFAR